MNNQLSLAKKDIRITNLWMLLLIICALVLCFLSFSKVLEPNILDTRMKDFVRGYQAGVSAGLLVFPLINLISNYFTLKNEDKLIARYIKYHDERYLFIHDKVGANSFMIEICTLLILSIIAPFFDFYLMVGFVLSIYLVVLVRGILYLYYNKKY